MILGLTQSHYGSTKLAPTMDNHSEFLPGLSQIGCKPVQAFFDGDLLTSGASILLLCGIEGWLGIAKRLDGCSTDRHDPKRIHHTLVEMIRFRTLMTAARYPDGRRCPPTRPSRWRPPGCPRVVPRCARSGPSPGWRTCPAGGIDPHDDGDG